MKVTRPAKAAGFTLVEIMIVVLIIGILLAIAIPNFVKARESSRTAACIANLKQIDSASQQYMMDYKLTAITSPPTQTAAHPALSGTNFDLSGYLRSTPTCPSSGLYTVGDGTSSTTTGKPVCSIGGTHILPQ